MTIEYTIIFSVITATIALVSASVGRATLKRLYRQDDKLEGIDMGSIKTQLDHIDKNIGNLSNSMENIRDDIKEQFERVIRVEESAKQAHRRLDELTKRAI